LETKRYKFKPKPPSELPVTEDLALINDEMWKLGIRTAERIKYYRLRSQVMPVISIPMYWDDKLKAFRLGYYPLVQVGDKTGTIINPATEDTLALVRAKTDNIDILLSSLRDTLKKNIGLTYIASQTVTANGDSTANPLDTSYGSVIVFFLDVTAVSGTSPTLDLYIDIQDPASGKWINQDKFATVSGTGTWALALPIRGVKYSCRWVLGGTTPSFTFSVGVVIIK
jgi:hypothetical protein